MKMCSNVQCVLVTKKYQTFRYIIMVSYYKYFNNIY